MHYTEEIKRKQKTLDERKKQLKLKATPSELIMKGLLLILKPKVGGVKFQKGFIAGNGYCICDFYIPQMGICIEVDGKYHWNEEQKKKDWYKDKYLTKERKMRVFRITNEECVDLTPERLLIMLRGCTRQSVTYSPRYS